MPNALIIDDSSTARMYYREILEGSGFVIEEALNGIEGLEKAMMQPFDLIVVDLNMPKMDGYTFLDQIRRTAELAGLPAIMISTEARPADRTRAFAAGANLYFVKPVDPLALAAHAMLLTGRATEARSAP